MPNIQNVDYELAQRVLKAVEDHRSPSQADALSLRLWAGPRSEPRPLEDIAKEIIKEGKSSASG